MCIRDRGTELLRRLIEVGRAEGLGRIQAEFAPGNYLMRSICLLYTSDAADERSSVDLGGRRIIKKKTTGT